MSFKYYSSLRVPPAYLCIALFTALIVVMLSPSISHAAGKCGGVETAIISCSEQGSGGLWSLLLTAINVLTLGIGIAAVGGIIYGAIQWATAADNSNQITKAKTTIFNVVIGLVAYALLYPFLQFIIPGGVFNRSVNLPVAQQSPPKTSETSTDGEKDDTAKTCYVVSVQNGKKIEGRMYHKSGSQTFAFENSPQGIRYAANHGYDSIDLDIHITKDGVPVATHWGKPMKYDGFHDPQGRLPKNASVKDMTFAQVSRLRHKDGQSQIYSLDRMIAVAATNKINLSLEVKSPILIRAHLRDIAGSLNKANVKAYFKGNTRLFTNMNDTLAAARRVGFWTRGTEGSQGWNRPNPTGCNTLSQTSQSSMSSLSTFKISQEELLG